MALLILLYRSVSMIMHVREREREGQTDRQTDIAWLAYRNIKILQLYTHTPPKQVSILLCRQCNAA